MDVFLESLSKITILSFVISCMIAAGLELRLKELAGPLCRLRLICGALVANFVVAPTLAWLLTRLMTLDRPYEIGLLLLGGAAGAPFLPKLVEMARGDVTYSVALMLLLVIGSVGFMPLALPLLIPGLSADPWPILQPLVFTMILPLAAGMLVRQRSESWATRLRRPVKLLLNTSMVAAVGLLISLHFSALRGVIGTGALGVGLIYVTLSIAVGLVLGGATPGTRSVLALGTGQRNVAAALVVAAQNFKDAGVTVMLLATTLVGLIPLLFATRWFARRASRLNVRQSAMAEGRVCVVPK